MPRRIVRRAGNRGLVLGALGLIYALRGYGTIQDPPPEHGLPDEHLPVTIRAALLVVPGFVAIAAAFWKRLDPMGWGLLAVPVLIRAVSYGWGIVTGSYPAGWGGALLYATVLLLINRCAAGLDRPAPWDGRERRQWASGRAP